MIRTSNQFNVSPEAFSKIEVEPLGACRPFACSSSVLGVAHWLPDKIVTSEELEHQLKEALPDLEFNIAETTGVHERRMATPGFSIIEMAANAAERALEQSGILPETIDTVIYASVHREYLEPSTATLIARRLGIQKACSFDLSNACLGFVDSWMLADSFVQSGRSRRCLIVAAETGSLCWKNALDFLRQGRENAASLLPCFTLGDGAAAMIVGKKEDPRALFHAQAGIRESYSAHSDLCVIQDMSSAMETNALGLFRAALKYGPPMTKEILNYLNWKTSEVDLVIPHQASEKIISQTAVLINIPETRAHNTLCKLGNIASVSVPLTLSDAFEKGLTDSAQRIFVMGYGSGFGLGMLGITPA